MLKILQVFASKIQKHGSFEDFMIELAKQSQERSFGIGFVFPDIKTQSVKQGLESFGANIYVVSKPWSSLGFVVEILRIVRKGKYDVIDFHFCHYVCHVLLFFILRLLGKKVVFHYHGEIRSIEELSFVNRHFSHLRALTLFPSKIICVSKANKRFLQALHIRKVIDVVYNGIKLDSFENMITRNDFRKKLGLEENDLVVASIGTLIPRKGMDVLIRAAKIVLEEVPKAKFIIIGGGNKEPYELIAKELKIEGRVIFTGLLKEYPFDILKGTDVYVSASFAESFGLSIAEAEILEIPVVATRVGGVLEVVNDGNTGFLVTSGDSKALAEKISLLLKDSALRKEMGRKGKKWVCDNFDLRKKVEELLEVLI